MPTGLSRKISAIMLCTLLLSETQALMDIPLILC